MTINVSEALDYDTSTRVTLLRGGIGSRVNGRFVAPAPTALKMLASIQQPRGSDLIQLMENERTLEIVKFICNRKVSTANDKIGRSADIINWDGVNYKIIYSENWNIYGHSTVMGCRL